LDISFLSFAEVEIEGNVNVNFFNNKITELAVQMRRGTEAYSARP
jgi:acyl CoA:acetate/3-ketoacid CoA transferase